MEQKLTEILVKLEKLDTINTEVRKTSTRMQKQIWHVIRKNRQSRRYP